MAPADRAQPQRIARPIGSALAAVLAVGLAMSAIGPARAERLPRVQPPEAAEPAVASTGVLLETNGDVDGLLDQAGRFLDAGEYRKAVVLYQHVANKYGSVLTSRDGRFYEPARLRVERTLAGLNDEGLAVYRLTADGEAQALLGGQDVRTCRDAAALRQVVRRYFVSSIGDDAAMVLGSILLDRYDYHGARRLFRKVRWRHPDPSVDRAALLLRLGLVSARLGDEAGAAEALEQLQRQPGSTDRQVALLRRQLDGPEAGDSAERFDDWPMRFGSPGRTGRLPGLGDTAADDGPDHLWAQVWAYDYPLPAPPHLQTLQPHRLPNARQSRSQMVERWTTHRWLPTTQMRFAGDRLLFKTHDTLICVDRRNGQTLWRRAEGDDDPSHRQVTIRHLIRSSSSMGDQPTTLEELLLFGDESGKAISIIGDAVYQIEHHQPIPSLSGHHLNVLLMRQRMLASNQSNRFEGNALVAIDLATGKLKWRLARSSDKNDPLREVRFAGVPVPAGDRLLVPLLREGELLLAALDPSDGRVIWQQFLCAPPAAELLSPRPVAVAVAGGEAYVVSGHGVLFAVDARRGRVIWAMRYQRDLLEMPGHQSNGMTVTGAVPTGWKQNAAFCRGSSVIVLPTDAKRLMAFDRASGQLSYQTKISKPRYAVGIGDEGLFIASAGALQRIDLSTGQMIWRAPIDRAHGRAALAGDAIYQPQADRIVRIDPRSGRRLAVTPVLTPRGDPVGNVICDGRRIYAAGMERVYALMDSGRLLAECSRRIDEQPTAQAYLARARVYQQTDEPDPVVADLRRAMIAPGDAAAKAQARRALVRSLLAMVASSPDRAGPMLDEAQALAVEPSQQLRVALARAVHLASSGQTIEAVEAFLALATADSETLIESEPGCEVAVSVAASAHLERLAESQSPIVSPMLVQRSAAELQTARDLESDPERCAALERLARLYPFTPAGGEALGEAAALAPQVGCFERLEALLCERAEASDPRTAGRALLALGSLYARRQWPGPARRAWQRVIEQSAEGPAAVAAEPPAEGETEPQPVASIGEVAGQKLAALGPDLPDAGDTPHRFGPPPWRRLWMDKGYGYQPVALGDDRPADSPFLRDHLLMVSRRHPPRLICRDLTDGQTAWQMDLPQQVAAQFVIDPQGTMSAGGRWGHILVLAMDDQLLGLSLVTGKRLWEHDATGVESGRPGSDRRQPLREASLVNPYQQRMGLRAIAVGEGIIARQSIGPEMTEQLEVRDAATGRLLWRRTFDGQAIDGVQVGYGAVIVFAGGAKELIACDRRTGRMIGRIEMDDLNPGRPLLWADQGVVYQDRHNRDVALVRLPECEPGWRIELDNWARLGQLDRHTAYLAQVNGKVRLINLQSGETLVHIAQKVLGSNLQDAAITPDGQQLYCLGYNGKSEQLLTVIDRASGKRAMQINFGRISGHRVAAATLVQAGEFLPWVERERKPNGSYTGRMGLAFYRKSTGERCADHHLPPPRGKEQGHQGHYVQAPPILAGGALIVTTNEGLMAFAHDPNPQPEEAAKPQTPGVTVTESGGMRTITADRDTPFRVIVEQIEQARRDGAKVEVRVKAAEE